MKVALTGATGFIGSHLIERLLADNHDIVALVRNDRDIQPLQAKGIKTARGAVENFEAAQRALDGADVVFNLARAKAHGVRPDSHVNATNVIGAANVARAASRAGARLVHAGSTAIYGTRVASHRAAEESLPVPDSIYARSKLEGERAVLSECPQATVLRISAVLGPRCHSWLPLFRSASNGTLRLIGDGQNLHHPVDVSDVVDALVLSSAEDAARGRSYNVAGPQPLAIRALSDLMSNAVGSTVARPAPVPKIIADSYLKLGAIAGSIGIRLPKLESVMFISGDRSFDISRARRELGFNPSISIESAVERTADYYRREGLL
jgi:nucleoside-diphosphate-sugar epimerase